MSRSDIKTRVLESATFKQFLLLDIGLKKALGNFLDSRYADVYDVLETRAKQLQYDMYLGSKLQDIMDRIRESMIINYVNSFTTVNLNKMAETLRIPITLLEDIIFNLITQKAIQFRIDGKNKALHANHTAPDLTSNVFQNYK